MSDLLNNEPLKYNAIDLNDIIYTKIKKSSSKQPSQIDKKIILTKYKNGDTNKNMVFQTPVLTCVSKSRNEQNVNEMEISFEEKNSKIIEFINFLTDLENKVKKDANIFAVQWFENMSDDNNNVNFQKIIRTNPKYVDGLLKLKMVNSSDLVTQIFNEQNKKISFENVKVNSKCKLLIEVYSIWVQKSPTSYDFGIYLRPVLIKFIEEEKPKHNYNYKLIENSESDVEDIPDTEINPNRNQVLKSSKEEDSIIEMNTIFMQPKPENEEMPSLETVYQTDNQQNRAEFMHHLQKNVDLFEKSFISVLTELNPDLLSKNYSETSDEEVFIKNKESAKIEVVSSNNSNVSTESSEIEKSETSEIYRNAEQSS